MSPVWIVAVLLLGLALWMVRRSILVVPEGEVAIVERLGRYHRTFTAGSAVLLPLLDRCAHRHRVDDQALVVAGVDTITLDNVHVVAGARLTYRIVDAQKASYGVAELASSLDALARTALRRALGAIAFERRFDEREAIRSDVRKTFDELADAWGVRLIECRIEDMSRGSDARART